MNDAVQATPGTFNVEAALSVLSARGLALHSNARVEGGPTGLFVLAVETVASVLPVLAVKGLELNPVTQALVPVASFGDRGSWSHGQAEEISIACTGEFYGVLHVAWRPHAPESAKQLLSMYVRSLAAVLSSYAHRSRAKTAFVRAEKAMGLLDRLEHATVWIDQTGRIRSFSEGATVLFGYTEADVIGRPFSILYSKAEADRGLALDDLERARAMSAYEVTRYQLRGDGSRFFAHLAIEVFPSGDFLAVITRRRFTILSEANTLLSSSLDLDKALQNVSRSAIPYFCDFCTIDLLEEGRLVRRAACHVDAKKERQVLEFTSTYGPRVPTRLEQILASGNSELFSDVDDDVLIALSSSQMHLEALRGLRIRSAMVIPLVARGRALGLISFVSSESKRRFGPDDLIVAEELAQRFALVIDNARLYEEASCAVKIREEFLSVASHELKTPLTSLQLQVQSVLRGLRNGEEFARSDAIRILESADRQSKRLAKLINDLLDVSRISAGKLDLEISRFDLISALDDVLSRFYGDLDLSGSSVDVTGRSPFFEPPTELDIWYAKVLGYDRSRERHDQFPVG